MNLTSTKSIQVSLLRLENKSLMRSLTEVSQRYNNVIVDNRILKANVETLETKVCYTYIWLGCN
jgi:hypothetical protein